MWSQNTNQDRFMSYVMNAIISNWKRAITVFAISFFVVMLYVRFSPIEYLPKTTFFAQVSRAGRTESASVIGALPEMERSVVISSQKQLVSSYPIYALVKESLLKEEEESNKKTDLAGSTTYSFFDRLIYGDEYLSGREKWRDSNYLSFKRKVYFEQDQNASTFSIGYSDRDPDKALLVTKIISKSLMALNNSIIDQKRKSLVENLEAQIKVTSGLLLEAQKAVTEFEVANSFPSTVDMSASTYRDLVAAKNDYLKSEMEQRSAEAALAALEEVEAEIGNYIKSQLKMGSEAEVTHLMQDIEERLKVEEGEDSSVIALKTKLEKLLISNIPFSSSETEKVIAELKKSQSTMKANLANLNKRNQLARQNFESLQKKMSEIPKLTSEMTKLKFTQDQREKLLTSLNQRYLAASVQESGADMNQFVQIEEPMITDASVQSNKGKSISYGIVFCLAIVLFASVGMHFIKGTIFTRHDLVKLGIPNHRCVGAVPFFQKLRLNNVLRTFASSEVINRSALNIKANLFPQGAGSTSKVILFTSAADKGGKSMSTLAMSMGLKRAGLSVIAIDCDYRANHSNLIEYTTLSKEAPEEITTWTQMSELIQAIGTKSKSDFNKSLNMVRPLPSDIEEKNAVIYLSQQLKSEIVELKKVFDVIILDGPPAFFTDSTVLGEHANALAICCPEGHTTRSEVEHIANEVGGSIINPDFYVFTIITQARLAENTSAQNQANIYQYRNRKDRLAA